MRRATIRSSANLLAFLALLFMNYLAVALPLGGRRTGEPSDRYDVLVTPADYAFGIWGLIYALLAAFVVYQAAPAQRGNPRLARLGFAFVAASLFTIGWLFAWHHDAMGWSLFAMIGILVSLIVAYRRLHIGDESHSPIEVLVIDLPFRLYLAWISVATIVNVAIALDASGIAFSRDVEVGLSIAVFAFAAILGFVLFRARRDVVFDLVLAWGLIAIAARQWTIRPVAYAASLAAAVVVAVPLAGRLTGKRRLAKVL